MMGTVPELTAYRRSSLSKSREGGTNKAVAIIDFVDQGRKKTWSHSGAQPLHIQQRKSPSETLDANPAPPMTVSFEREPTSCPSALMLKEDLASIQSQATHLRGLAAGKTAVNEAIAAFPWKKFFQLYCS